MDGFDLECMDRQRQRDQRLSGVDLAHLGYLRCLVPEATRILTPRCALDMDGSGVFRFQPGPMAPRIRTRVQVWDQISDSRPSCSSLYLALQLPGESVASFAFVGDTGAHDGHGAAEPGNPGLRKHRGASGKPVKVETLCPRPLLRPLGF